MVLGEADAATARPSGQVVVLECTLDDSTPQALAFAAERLPHQELRAAPAERVDVRDGLVLRFVRR